MLLDLLPLFVEAATTATTVVTGGGGVRRNQGTGPWKRRRPNPGAGHLHITLELHGEPGPVLSTEGRLRSKATLALPTAAARLRRTVPVLGRTSSTARAAATHQIATHGQLKDPADLWLLLDLPELA